VLLRENNEGLYMGYEHFIPIDGAPRDGMPERRMRLTLQPCLPEDRHSMRSL